MARTISINFEGVEAGGGSSVQIPEGDYGLKISKIVKKTGEKGDYLNFALKVLSGNKKGIGKTVYHNCSLTKQSLWNLRNLLEATGSAVPSKAIKIDLDKFIGKTLAATVVDDEFKGKKKSSVGSFFPMSELAKAEDKDTDDEAEESDDSGDDAEETGGEESGEEEELFG